MNPVANVSTNWKNRWRKPGDEKYTDIPVLYNDRVASGFDRNVSAEDRGAVEECTYFYDLSDLRVAKADFLRLRSVGLSYIMPEKLLKGVGISSMMIRFQASNLFVWAHKDWKGLDPETPEANIPILPFIVWVLMFILIGSDYEKICKDISYWLLGILLFTGCDDYLKEDWEIC